MMRKFILLLTSCTVFSSCQKELNTPKGAKSDIVVKSILIVGHPIKVEVSYAIPIGNPMKEKPVKVKSVELIENEQLLEILEYDSISCNYFGRIVIQQRRHYTIRVITTDQQVITASTYTPQAINVDVSTDYIDNIDNFDKKVIIYHPKIDTLCYMGCFFLDKDSFKLMYEDTIIIKYNRFPFIDAPKEVEFADYAEKISKKTRKIFFELLDSSMYGLYFRNPEKDFGRPSVVFYSNKTFIGNSYPLTFETYFGPSTYLHFITLSSELYYALRSIATQNSLQKSNLNNLFSSPNQIISNVKGGLGFVGSCNISVIPFRNSKKL
ncbi:MAG: DUF4249 domain-containing protein [Bacteroidales bacterium]|nr:DUF4249 domain-containing protein [Bacteroidales bacterium]